MTREQVKVELMGAPHHEQRHLTMNKQQQQHCFIPAPMNHTKQMKKMQQQADHELPLHFNAHNATKVSVMATNKQRKHISDDTNKELDQINTMTQTPQPNSGTKADHNSATIAIMRRHPMYDSLVLVKQFNQLLGAQELAFPGSSPSEPQQQKQSECSGTKLVSVYLDGDDPIYQCNENQSSQLAFIRSFAKQSREETNHHNHNSHFQPANGHSAEDEGEIVYVPINGLLERLESYENSGVKVDAKVQAFAIGLKTAEKFLTLSGEKEIQETPPL